MNTTPYGNANAVGAGTPPYAPRHTNTPYRQARRKRQVRVRAPAPQHTRLCLTTARAKAQEVMVMRKVRTSSRQRFAPVTPCCRVTPYATANNAPHGGSRKAASSKRKPRHARRIPRGSTAAQHATRCARRPSSAGMPQKSWHAPAEVEMLSVPCHMSFTVQRLQCPITSRRLNVCHKNRK